MKPAHLSCSVDDGTLSSGVAVGANKGDVVWQRGMMHVREYPAADVNSDRALSPTSHAYMGGHARYWISLRAYLGTLRRRHANRT